MSVIKRRQLLSGGIWEVFLNIPKFENESDWEKCERVYLIIDDKTLNVLKEEHYFSWYRTSIYQTEFEEGQKRILYLKTN